MLKVYHAMEINNMIQIIRVYVANLFNDQIYHIECDAI